VYEGKQYTAVLYYSLILTAYILLYRSKWVII